MKFLIPLKSSVKSVKDSQDKSTADVSPPEGSCSEVFGGVNGSGICLSGGVTLIEVDLWGSIHPGICNRAAIS